MIVNFCTVKRHLQCHCQRHTW